MADIKVPEFGDSIQEVQVFQWLKKPGDWVERDEDVVELESEKASQALPAPVAGVLQSIAVAEGEIAKIGDLLCIIDESATQESAGQGAASAAVGGDATAVADAPPATGSEQSASWIMPAAQLMLTEYAISANAISPSGPGGRLLKEDVIRHVAAQKTAAPAAAPVSATDHSMIEFNEEVGSLERSENVKPMSMIRRTIARRLVEAQNDAALLTTFNEIDMQPVMELRSKYKEPFLKKHGVKLGFMSFFAKASVEALKRFPAINAQIDGNNVIYHNYCDVGIAIGGGKGLVVPILRSVEQLSFAAIERTIGKFAGLAQENKIKPEDLQGGTFTISNGGVYGSLLSTPIVNPPQSGILGLHSIQKRPVVVDDQIVIRPMMYVALTYDHRIVDGREAVQFLKTIKEVLEEPARLFLEV